MNCECIFAESRRRFLLADVDYRTLHARESAVAANALNLSVRGDAAAVCSHLDLAPPGATWGDSRGVTVTDAGVHAALVSLDLIGK